MLNKEDILCATNRGLDVFRHYLGMEIRLGRNFRNPLYDDRHASCNVFYDKKNNRYRIKDFGNDDYSGDPFSFVGKIKRLDCGDKKDFTAILETIDADMHLGLEKVAKKPLATGMEQIKNGNYLEKAQSRRDVDDATFWEGSVRPEKACSHTRKEYAEEEKAYWGKYGIYEDTLNRYSVISLMEYKGENSEGKPFVIRSSKAEPMYAYLGKKRVKIYRPFSQMRFLYGGTLDGEYCFGLEQLPPKGDTLFITGGEKDVMSLSARGYNAVCFNSETSHIPPELIRKLSYRFKHILFLYDTDKTGMDASERHLKELSEFGVKRLVLPLKGTKEEKDISDYFTKYGKENFRKLFINLLDKMYSETMDLLKPCEVGIEAKPPQAITIVSINGVPLGTEGNLMGIAGAEGCGKSSYASAIIAGAIRDESEETDTLGTSVMPDRAEKAVLLYDTEQSEAQLYKNVKNLINRSGNKCKPEYLKIFCMTCMSRKERLQSIVQSMDRYYYEYGGIHLVVIDGIADLVKSANDEAESIAVVEELYRLAGIYKTCIICVLHYIPNGLKPRGHIGSELLRKAAAMLSIEKEEKRPGISIVKALKVRDGSPYYVPIIQFAWDSEKGMHVYIGDKQIKNRE